ncbi:hypothetical protein F5J12DRAFT_152655 [Pisolithus orientalis]|uniref:uncharacterized protein n=1 Tax=Pisolithus orientalis TaxID=936130 RepID=UPI002224F1D5|nr:uncharacterized protein F5J12DRAFT_152655 [Pisolithus orientalis]KAI5983000.1 hypothetical protein F5J12DRAFT_152655 [Pisolithus orientalis]
MTCLFASPLQNMVYGSTLFMLTCGLVVSFEQSLAALKQSIAQLRPEYTVTFTAKDFLNTVVKTFIVSYGVKVLIEGHALENIIHDLLDVSLELRMHTDVMLFHLSGLGLPRVPWLLSPAPLTATPLLAIYRYSWYHSHRRPWGTSLSMGCLKCGAIHPWARSKLDPHPPSGYHLKTRVSTCRKCTFEVCTQPLPVEYDVLHGNPTSGWLKYTVCAAVPL